jgi:NAD(P)-dependent dehydrogenase (short-subunit alcohol dehydrogenase family)
MSFEGKIVFITGAASGIGAEVARQLAAQGARLATCDVNDEAGQALAEELGAEHLHGSVAQFASIEHAVGQCIERLGVPDFALLNAGVMTVPTDEPFLRIEDVTLEQYHRIVSVNLGGVYHGLKLLLPRMRSTDGTITVTASMAGFGALPVDPLYASTKAALIALTRSVAAANAQGPLRINAICPGVVDTPIVPEDFKAPEFGMMPASVLAAEILDLMAGGDNGEVRVKLKDQPGFAVPPQSDSFQL